MTADGNPKATLQKTAAWYLEEQLDIDRAVIEFSFRTVRPYLKGPRGLELGPAEGQMTRLLVGQFEHLTIVDAAAELLAAIPQAPNLTKVESLFEEFEPSERFDTILLMQTLPILADPVAQLRRFRSWLAPAGRLIVAVPNANSIHRLAAVKMGLLEVPSQLSERDHITGNRRVYTPQALSVELSTAGFRIEHTEGVFLKPLSYRQIQEWWSPEIIEAFFELGRDFPEHAALLVAICL